METEEIKAYMAWDEGTIQEVLDFQDEVGISTEDTACILAGKRIKHLYQGDWDSVEWKDKTGLPLEPGIDIEASIKRAKHDLKWARGLNENQYHDIS